MNVPAYIIYVLIKYYDVSYLIVDKNGEFSELFRSLLGCKQGGVLSPRLFTIYMRKLIDRLDTLGLGFMLYEILLNCLLYADDIALLSDNHEHA